MFGQLNERFLIGLHSLWFLSCLVCPKDRRWSCICAIHFGSFGGTLSAFENTSLITQFICKLRGGSQPILAQASDGLVYVVKFTNNPQGANLPFNESIGSELYRVCQLPFAEWKPLLVTDTFLDQNPGCWMESADGYVRPDPGVCFGSRFLVGDSYRLLEILPGTSFKRVHNHIAFWLAWLIDICAGHTDHRQAIFMEDCTGGLNAFFVDHGHLFCGPNGKERRPFTASRYIDPRIYQSVSPRQIQSFQNEVKNLNVDCVWRKVQALPADWRTGSAINALTQCLHALASARLVENVLETMVDAFQRNKQGSRDECKHHHIGRMPLASVPRPGAQAVAQEQGALAC